MTSSILSHVFQDDAPHGGSVGRGGPSTEAVAWQVCLRAQLVLAHFPPPPPRAASEGSPTRARASGMALQPAAPLLPRQSSVSSRGVVRYLFPGICRKAALRIVPSGQKDKTKQVRLGAHGPPRAARPTQSALSHRTSTSCSFCGHRSSTRSLQMSTKVGTGVVCHQLRIRHPEVASLVCCVLLIVFCLYVCTRLVCKTSVRTYCALSDLTPASPVGRHRVHRCFSYSIVSYDDSFKQSTIRLSPGSYKRRDTMCTLSTRQCTHSCASKRNVTVCLLSLHCARPVLPAPRGVRQTPFPEPF